MAPLSDKKGVTCSFDYLQSVALPPREMCTRIAGEVCASGHYYNMFEMYYCHLGQNATMYFVFVALCFAYSMFTLNYIRRTYYIQHIQRLRHILATPQWVTESVFVPISYGIVPILIRLIASVNKIEFGFQTGANVGACFNLITLFTGLCAMKIGLSPKIDMEMFSLNTLFIIIGNLLHLPLGFRKVVNDFDAGLYIIIFSIYMLCRYFLHRRKIHRVEQDKKIALIEGKEALPTSSSVVEGLRLLTEHCLRIEAAQLHRKETAEMREHIRILTADIRK
jgi:hypothetical protein